MAIHLALGSTPRAQGSEPSLAKSSSSGNRTPGVCVTGRNVTNYTNEDHSLGITVGGYTWMGCSLGPQRHPLPAYPVIGVLSSVVEHRIADPQVTSSNLVVPSFSHTEPRAQHSKNCASSWARTSDLSVNSRALCQLSHGGVSYEVLPGLEPGPLDSKSRVLTN